MNGNAEILYSSGNEMNSNSNISSLTFFVFGYQRSPKDYRPADGMALQDLHDNLGGIRDRNEGQGIMRGESGCMANASCGRMRPRLCLLSVSAASTGLDGTGHMGVVCLFTFEARRVHRPYSPSLGMEGHGGRRGADAMQLIYPFWA